jgi:CubicO group peptidase (beta-lactamase class C family)
MTSISGTCDARFRGVQDAFHRNFAEGGELGAAVCVMIDGRAVVDLWGGVADHVSRRPLSEDTLTLIFSATKGATALCAHMLVSRGLLDLDEPVATYWPEFAAAGKQRLPVRMLLNHQAGLPAVDEPMPPDAIFDWDAMTRALASQPPHWPPGTAHGYHAMTFGWLVGEVIRRVGGKSMGQFFAEEVAGPLGLDFWIGLPEEHEARVSRLRLPAFSPEPTPMMAALLKRESLTSKAFLNPRGLMQPGQANSRAVHAAEIPAANGIATARAVARMYAPLSCGGKLGEVTLVDCDTLAAMGRVESEGMDRILLMPTRFASGFGKTMDNRPGDSALLGPNPEAFGHGGAGGSIGMADPVARLSIGYVMNQLGPGILLNERGQSLIDAVYESL